MSEFIAPSGVKVTINLAPWGDVKALKKAIERELAVSGITLDKDADATAFVEAILRVDSSEDVEKALWPCLVRCLRGNDKIVESTFDDAKARGDYYQIITACIKENLGPLFESLSSLLPKGIISVLQDRQKPSVNADPA